jgi:hypothetical protein
MFACVSMAPFGVPVVPEVYAMRHRSSTRPFSISASKYPGCAAPNVRPRASTSVSECSQGNLYCDIPRASS